MLDHLNKYKILLASNSPRRRELLKGLDINFEVKVLENIDESYPAQIKGKDIPLYLANKKADHYELEKNELLITADTIVIVDDDQILGKPKNEAEATKMLKLLSANVHIVATGVCIRTYTETHSFTDISEVEFDKLSDDEIGYYLKKYKPYDKAGSYGIQEWIGYIGVKKINGSYFNIMGLPVQKLYKVLSKIH